MSTLFLKNLIWIVSLLADSHSGAEGGGKLLVGWMQTTIKQEDEETPTKKEKKKKEDIFGSGIVAFSFTPEVIYIIRPAKDARFCIRLMFFRRKRYLARPFGLNSSTLLA